MCGLYHLEDDFAVGDIECCFSEFFVEGDVVEQIEVLQHEQSCRLEIRIQSQHGAQLVQRIAVESLWVVDEFCYLHISILYSLFTTYQFATVALNIWSQRLLVISVTSSSCTALSDCVVS